MAKVNLVDKKVQMQLAEIIKFQLLSHCYIKGIMLSELDLDCLTNLGLMGEAELTDFCNMMADKRLESRLELWANDAEKSIAKRPQASPQTIRNVLIKVEREKLLKKEGKGRKKIYLNPDLQIQTVGNIVLNYKFFHIESEKAV